MPKKTPTWLELAVHEAGFRKAITALTWVNMWGVAREALGHTPTVEEVADWWNEPHRTAYREQAAFRDCFQRLETPEPLADHPQARAAFRKSLERWTSFTTRAQRLKGIIPEPDILALGYLPAPPAALPEPEPPTTQP